MPSLMRRAPVPLMGVGIVLGLASLCPAARVGAQTAITCPAASGVAPGGITATNTPPTVTIRWNAVSGARSYAIVRRNPDGTCWSIATRVTSTSFQAPLPTVPGSYQFQVAAMTFGGSGVSQPVTLTLAAPAPATAASRTFSLAGFTAAGAIAVASRSFTLAGFSAAGVATAASRSFSLAGFTGVGPTLVPSRTFTLAGFTATGTSAPAASRTITLAGWTAAGPP